VRVEKGDATIRTLVNGFCMALADSVPGVSGGTIAVVMGFYESLLDAVHGLFRGSGAGRRSSAGYLARLGCGWVVGMTLALLLLSRVLDAEVYMLSSAFIGLTIAAIPIFVYSQRDVMRGHGRLVVLSIAGAAVVAGLAFAMRGGEAEALDFATLAPWQFLFVFVAGAIASSAMILPGISGSTLLLIFGVYAPAVIAFRQVVGLNLAVAPALAVLATGIVCGLAVSIGLVRMLLKRHRAAMAYLIVGLMADSLFSIVQGPTTMSVPQPALAAGSFNVFACVAGACLVVGLELVGRARAGSADA